MTTPDGEMPKRILVYKGGATGNLFVTQNYNHRTPSDVEYVHSGQLGLLTEKIKILKAALETIAYNENWDDQEVAKVILEETK